MTAMMILIVLLLAVGPYHGMMGSHDAGANHAGAPYTQMHTNGTPQPEEDKP